MNKEDLQLKVAELTANLKEKATQFSSTQLTVFRKHRTRLKKQLAQMKEPKSPQLTIRMK